MELDPQESPEEIKSREVELGSESWTLLLQLLLNSSATDMSHKYIHPDRHTCSFRTAEFNDLLKPIL